MSKDIPEAEVRKTGRHYVRSPDAVKTAQAKLAALNEIIDLGLPYREMARRMEAKLGKPVHPYSVISFIERSIDLERRYQTACKNREQNDLEDEVSDLAEKLEQVDTLAQRLKVLILKEPPVLRDTVTYLMENPLGKQPAWKIYALFQLYHEKKNSSVIARELELNPITVRSIIDAVGNKNTDGRGMNAELLPWNTILRIRELGSTHKYADIGRMLNCSRSSVSRYVNMTQEEFDALAKRK